MRIVPHGLIERLYFQQPYHIHSFEDNSDYVYDVRWSPIHPALFASVDGEGRLDLWNLNSETEVSLVGSAKAVNMVSRQNGMF